MRVAFVSAEAAPWAKTGGLGDVVGSLPAALKNVDEDLQVVVFLPLYERVWTKLHEKGIHPELTDVVVAARLFGQSEFGYIRTWTDENGVIWAFVEHHNFYHRGGLYGDSHGEYFDAAARFAFLCRAALDASPRLLGGPPDIFHCHDWHTGALPMYLQTRYAPAYPRARSIMTIHNLGYQGVYDKDTLPNLGLPWSLFRMDVCEFYDHLNLLKGGIACADATTTVSPTYAREMLTPEGGVGQHEFIRHRARRFRGIVNGLGPEQRSPDTDPHLPANYSIGELGGKYVCREHLLREAHLHTHYGEPVIGVVSRFVGQKGLDIVADIVPALPRLGARLIVLGSGSQVIEDRFKHLARVYPRHLSIRTAFDPPYANRIYAGSDMFLVPSRFEPCGLTQLQSMAYGTVPIVRAVGGLRDTVFDPAEAGQGANGFCFFDFDANALYNAIRRAVSVYRNNPAGWRQLQLNGMRRDSTWETSAKRYLQLYHEVL